MKAKLLVPVLLALIVVLGAGLRLYHLAGNPPELIVDEIDLYNSARSIALTGHDIDGTLLPFFDCPLTRNPPVYAIAAYASSLIAGNSPFGLRLPAVVFGLVAIVLMYGIAFELTRRRDIALVTALLQATQPIFIHFSRSLRNSNSRAWAWASRSSTRSSCSMSIGSTPHSSPFRSSAAR